MKLNLLLAATVLAALTACANTTHKPLNPEELALSKGYLLGNPVDGIRNYTLNGWNHVNDRAIIIDSSVNKRYLVTLREHCHELSTSNAIGTTATAGQMRAGFDAVLVRRAGAGRSLNSIDTHKCYIDKIYMLSKIKKTNP